MGYYEVDIDDWAEIDFHPDLEDIRKKYLILIKIS